MLIIILGLFGLVQRVIPAEEPAYRTGRPESRIWIPRQARDDKQKSVRMMQ